MRISVSDINPFVRNMGVALRQNHKTLVRPYDCRLLYMLEGSCQLSLNSRLYEMERDSLAIITPDDIYMVRSHPHMRMAVFSFDFTQNDRYLRQPLLYDPVDSFREEDVSQRVSLTDGPSIRGIFIASLPQVRETVEKMLLAGLSESPVDRAMSSCQMKFILLEALRGCDQTEQASAARQLAQKIHAYVYEHYADDMTLASLAQEFRYHASYINRVLVRWEGLSAHRLILKCRMEKALSLLQDTDIPVAQVARQVGYPDPKHFSRVFSSYYRKPPSLCR